MMRSLLRTFGLAAVVATSLHAQAPAGSGVVTSWTPFYGCWTSSSAGAIGPMVCVVPGASREQVEFMTVRDDAIVGRTVVDASGKRVPALRPGCAGWEQGQWTSDGQRLLLRAEVRCGKRRVQRSDAILSFSHADAFTQVERLVSDRTAEPRVVNFMVQLDTTVFPVEVRRRLPHLRPLSVETAELETLPDLPPSLIVEVASALDAGVVQAWLSDRGQLTPDLLTATRLISAAARGNDLPQPYAREPRSGVRNSMSRFSRVGVYSSALPVYLTANHGNQPLGLPGLLSYWELGAFFQQGGMGVPFNWP